MIDSCHQSRRDFALNLSWHAGEKRLGETGNQVWKVRRNWIVVCQNSDGSRRLWQIRARSRELSRKRVCHERRKRACSEKYGHTPGSIRCNFTHSSSVRPTSRKALGKGSGMQPGWIDRLSRVVVWGSIDAFTVPRHPCRGRSLFHRTLLGLAFYR